MERQLKEFAPENYYSYVRLKSKPRSSKLIGSYNFHSLCNFIQQKYLTMESVNLESNYQNAIKVAEFFILINRSRIVLGRVN